MYASTGLWEPWAGNRPGPPCQVQFINWTGPVYLRLPYVGALAGAALGEFVVVPFVLP